jgi:hypothetical protein
MNWEPLRRHRVVLHGPKVLKQYANEHDPTSHLIGKCLAGVAFHADLVQIRKSAFAIFGQDRSFTRREISSSNSGHTLDDPGDSAGSHQGYLRSLVNNVKSTKSHRTCKANSGICLDF